MGFEDNKRIEKVGEKVGFVFMYFVFTTVLYFILSLLKKLPAGWTYFHIALITLFIVLLGTLIKMLLK